MKVFKTLGLGILTGHYLAILEATLLAMFLMLDFAVEGSTRGWTSTSAYSTEPGLIIRDCWYVLGARIFFGFCAIDGFLLGFLCISETKLPTSAVCLLHTTLLLLFTWVYEPELARQVIILRFPLYRFALMPFLAFAAAISPAIMSRVRFIPNTMLELHRLKLEAREPRNGVSH